MAKRKGKRKQKTVPYSTIEQAVWQMDDFDRMNILHDHNIPFALEDNLSKTILANLSPEVRKAIMKVGR